jgi:hypothetical protein
MLHDDFLRRRIDMPRMPVWKTPKNISKVLKDDDGFWEDERWSPISLTAMTGTQFGGREIPIAWQIEFDPSDILESANAKLEALGIDPDGYGWGEYIKRTIKQSDKKLAKKLHLTDCEFGACVIWVESADDCRVLMEATWNLIFGT